MLLSDRALRALLASNFVALTKHATSAPQIEEIVALVMDATLTIMRDLVADWNQRSLISCLPDEILAACFTYLPFRDCITASHVSRSWRKIALQYPAVWAQIEISVHAPDQLALITMALARSKQHPVCLKYQGHRSSPFGIADAVQRHIHRLRAVEWISTERLMFDQPLPLLELLTANHIVLSTSFFTRQLDRVHTLHVPIQCLRGAIPGPMNSVRQLSGHAAPGANVDVSTNVLPHIFQLFPRLESLTLTGLESPLGPVPTEPAPPTLVRLRLFGAKACAGDLVELYLAWQTAHLQEIELRSDPNRVDDPLARPMLRQFFSNAIELSIRRWAGRTMCVSGRDAQGHTLVFGFDGDTMDGTLAAGLQLARAIWNAIGNEGAASIASVSLAVDALSAVLGVGRALSAVHTVVVIFDCERHTRAVGDEHSYDTPWGAVLPTQCDYEWSEFGQLVLLSLRFPTVRKFTVDLECDGGCRPGLATASRMLNGLATHGSSSCPDLLIRGFGADVVRNIDPWLMQQLEMKVEFDMSQ